MSLKEQLASDMEDVFLNEGEFAESVVYFAGGDLSTEGRRVSALAERTRPETFGFARDVQPAVVVELHVSRDAQRGIVKVDVLRDRFRLPAHEGGEDALWRVQKVLNADPGAFQLLLVAADPTKRRVRGDRY